MLLKRIESNKKRSLLITAELYYTAKQPLAYPLFDKSLFYVLLKESTEAVTRNEWGAP